MSTFPADPVKDALAWFIQEDETNSGGQQEIDNRYWLSGRRAASMYFSSQDELTQRAARHIERMGAYPESWPMEFDDRPQTNSAHELIATQSLISHWGKYKKGDPLPDEYPLPFVNPHTK